MAAEAILQLTQNGLYCAAGDFYIDPWLPVERAVITHAHADHACPGSRRYLTTCASEKPLRARLGVDTDIQVTAYGEAVTINGVSVSLHPAGHILGSAQVRLEHGGEVWVVSGDYKLEPDSTCTPFEPVRCHTFVTESTFGLPIYRWPSQSEVIAEIHSWWRSNQAAGKASLLFGYPLGKAQRLLSGLDPGIGLIFTHGAVEKFNAIYREAGVPLPATVHAASAPRGTDWSQALILAPPLAHGTAWARKFSPASTGLASGWMQIRGTRRRRSVDRGFIFSDHGDWPALLKAISDSGAARVWVTHGYTAVLARWLCEQGREAVPVQTRFEGERDEAPVELAAEGENQEAPA
jgi:putative mRNA 3-end processing factor